MTPSDAPPSPSVSLDASAGDALAAAAVRHEALARQLDALNDLLARPLGEIVAERDKAQESAAAWDAFGAMWMLSQRAMKRVALDLAAQAGVSEAEVVARALAHANEVLYSDIDAMADLGGLLPEAQLAHIARHRNLLRKQFRSD